MDVTRKGTPFTAYMIGVVSRVCRRTLTTMLAILASAFLLPSFASAATWSPCIFTLMQLDCATYDFPIDRTGAVPGTTKVRAVRAAATEGPRIGTLFVIAGGPGQPSDMMIDFMVSLFTGANRYDVVAVDLRGTGLSEPLNCPRIENDNFRFDGGDPKTDKPITSCATALGAARSGYDSEESIQDLEAVRADLGATQVSLFGVSYGTKVALAYAGQYPASVKSLLIDSVLPVQEPSAFDLTSVDAMRKSIEQICGGSRCKGVVSSPLPKLAKLALLLQKHPIDTYIVDLNGKAEPAKIDDEALYDILFAADFNMFIYNQLPSAIDAATRGNAIPLTRIFALANGSAGASVKRHAAKEKFGRYLPKRRGSIKPHGRGQKLLGRDEFSVSLFSNTTNLVTSCEDFNPPWARGAPLANRQAAIDAAVNAVPDSAFFPFPRRTVRNSSLAALCRGYQESPDTPALPSGPLPSVPTLALDGSLDVRTPVAWAKSAVAGNPMAQVAVIPNTGHSTIGTDVSGCALSLAKRFLLFDGVDGKCSRTAKPIPVAPRAVGSVRNVKPLSGKCTGLRARRCTSAKQVVTAGYLAMRDALDQYVIGGMFEGPGLYEGGWFLEADIANDFMSLIPVAIFAAGISQVPGVSVSGRLDIEQYPRVGGTFRVNGPTGKTYRVEISGKAAYDANGDAITLRASSGRTQITLRRHGKGLRTARVSGSDLRVRSNFARAAGIQRLLR